MVIIVVMATAASSVRLLRRPSTISTMAGGVRLRGVWWWQVRRGGLVHLGLGRVRCGGHLLKLDIRRRILYRIHWRHLLVLLLVINRLALLDYNRPWRCSLIIRVVLLLLLVLMVVSTVISTASLLIIVISSLMTTMRLLLLVTRRRTSRGLCHLGSGILVIPDSLVFCGFMALLRRRLLRASLLQLEKFRLCIHWLRISEWIRRHLLHSGLLRGSGHREPRAGSRESIVKVLICRVRIGSRSRANRCRLLLLMMVSLTETAIITATIVLIAAGSLKWSRMLLVLPVLMVILWSTILTIVCRIPRSSETSIVVIVSAILAVVVVVPTMTASISFKFSTTIMESASWHRSIAMVIVAVTSIISSTSAITIQAILTVIMIAILLERIIVSSLTEVAIGALVLSITRIPRGHTTQTLAILTNEHLQHAPLEVLILSSERVQESIFRVELEFGVSILFPKVDVFNVVTSKIEDQLLLHMRRRDIRDLGAERRMLRNVSTTFRREGGVAGHPTVHLIVAILFEVLEELLLLFHHLSP